MKVSVIIPTYNEAKVITECIESLSKQKFSDFEIIVVDDGSTDGTEIKDHNIKFYQQKHLGAGMARNLGAKHARGSVLVFVDADMTFDKNFLKDLTKPVFRGQSKGTFSKNEFVSNWSNIWARCWNINAGWQEKKRHPKNYPSTQKVFRSILKSEFDRVGGFDKGGYTDDWSLSEKLSYQATLAPGAIFYHKNPSSLREVFRHTQWVGQRKYKFGAIGKIIALLRASFPISLIVGILKLVFKREPRFLIFKIVYDLGLTIGIIKYHA